MYKYVLVLVALIIVSSCSKKVSTTYSYLALGDSYTIGESVPESERWPVLLASGLTDRGLQVNLPNIVATTGWTTEELMEGIEKANLMSGYDLVSLLIGVNDQYRGYPIENYEPNFERLLQKALEFGNDSAQQVFVLSIPDYGVTPFGQSSDPEKIGNELDAYNAVAKSVCEKYGVQFFNITDISRMALNDQNLIAVDRLHPSGEMYKMWVELIIDDIKSKLE